METRIGILSRWTVWAAFTLWAVGLPRESWAGDSTEYAGVRCGGYDQGTPGQEEGLGCGGAYEDVYRRQDGTFNFVLVPSADWACRVSYWCRERDGDGNHWIGDLGWVDPTGRLRWDAERGWASIEPTPIGEGAPGNGPPFLDILRSLAQQHGIPVAVLAAVMMAESGGRPNEVGDSGCSVGLYQLNACGGLGNGMGDSRYDPWTNASVGASALARSWRVGLSLGLSGEALVRYAYNFGINPGGGWSYQGDAVVRFWYQYVSVLA